MAEGNLYKHEHADWCNTLIMGSRERPVGRCDCGASDQPKTCEASASAPAGPREKALLPSNLCAHEVVERSTNPDRIGQYFCDECEQYFELSSADETSEDWKARWQSAENDVEGLQRDIAARDRTIESQRQTILGLGRTIERLQKRSAEETSHGPEVAAVPHLGSVPMAGASNVGSIPTGASSGKAKVFADADNNGRDARVLVPSELEPIHVIAGDPTSPIIGHRVKGSFPLTDVPPEFDPESM